MNEVYHHSKVYGAVGFFNVFFSFSLSWTFVLVIYPHVRLNYFWLIYSTQQVKLFIVGHVCLNTIP